MKFTVIVSLLICCVTYSVSCRGDNESNRPETQEPKEQGTLPEVPIGTGDDAINALQLKLDRDSYYFESLSIERLMGIGDDLVSSVMRKPVLTNAMILSVDNGGAVTIKEHVVGGPISDYTDYLPQDPNPGEYLVGLLMPNGGWGMGRRVGRSRFCCVMLSSDTFSYGFQGELIGEIESIKQFKEEDR